MRWPKTKWKSVTCRSFLFIILAGLSGLAAYAQPGTLVDGIVAVVGNQPVLKSDIEAEKITMKQQGFGMDIPDLDCIVMEEMLFTKLLVFQAVLDSIEVSEGEIMATVEQRLNYFISQLGSPEAFEQYYGKSIAEFKADFHDPIKEQLQSQKMMGNIQQGVKVTPREVEKFFNKIPKDSLPLISAQVQYAQIVIDPAVRQSQKDKERRFLDSIRTEIMLGKTTMFAQAARHSEDPGSKLKGGCYPLQRRGIFAAEFEAAVFSTDQGGYSPIFETQFGYHFVYVKEKRGEYYEACHVLRRPKVTEEDMRMAEKKLEDVSRLLKADSLSFKAAARKYSTDSKTSNNDGVVLNRETGSTRHDVDKLPGSDFFIIDNLEPGEMSKVVAFTKDDGTESYRIIKLLSRTEAHRASLKTDYELIKSTCLEKKKKEVLDEWVNSRLKHVFIRISPEHSDCKFDHSWGTRNP
jgi:peptidyl-prolyl cis-trans isomerase SurA